MEIFRILSKINFWRRAWWIVVIPWIIYCSGEKRIAMGFAIFYIVYFVILLPLIEQAISKIK